MESVVMGVETGNGTTQLILWAGEEKFKDDIDDCFPDEFTAKILGGSK